jgi:SulP family sulfate permease
VVSGLVTGLFSIPEGMAYAIIGGFNPFAGGTCLVAALLAGLE